MKLVEQIHKDEHLGNFRTRYIKYRTGRLKHQYWLWNRKNPTTMMVDKYDAFILKNCQSGRTAFFASSGYYLRDIWNEIDSIEMHPVVKEFYPDVILVDHRNEIHQHISQKYDNFAVVNNRGDHWVDLAGLSKHLSDYCLALNPRARLFYSFRDTQIHYNRLKVDAEQYFLSWARGLTDIGLTVAWHHIDFKKKLKDGNGNYDAWENPDTVNGNIKFWFTYQDDAWTIEQ